MVDLKRLITVFLIVSALTSSSVFLISSITDRRASRPSPESTQKNAAPQIAAGANVFIEDIPQAPRLESGRALALLESGDLPPFIPTENLTQNLAQALTREVIQANPEGPRNSAEGAPSFFVPDTPENIIELALGSSPSRSLVPEIDEAKIKINPNPVNEDFPDYLESVASIIASTYSGPDVVALEKFEAEAGPELLNAAHLVYLSAEEKLYSLSVPAPLLEAHKSFLQLVAYHRTILDESNYRGDPLRTLAAINNAPDALTKIQGTIEAEMARFKQEFLTESWLLPKRATLLSQLGDSFQGFIGTPRARAFFGGFAEDSTTGIRSVASVATVVQTTTSAIQGSIIAGATVTTSLTTKLTLLERIFRWIRLTATEILKDQVVHMMVQQIIGWVQGGGKPQFITNWKGFLLDVGNEAAGNLIAKYRPGWCSSFGPLLEVALQPVPNIELRRSACTLNQVIGNVRGFYDNFRSGGWVAYGATFQTNNNLYGSLIGYHDKIMREEGEAKEAASKEAGAGKGFLGVKLCPIIDIDPNTRTTSSIVIRPGKGGLCPGGKEPIITSPGEAAAGLLDTALGAPLHRIVNAQDFTALVSALVNSALNRLIKAGASGITGMFNSSRSTTDASGLAGTCAGLTGQAFTDCQNSASGVIKTIGSAPSSSPSSTLPVNPPTPAPTSTIATSTVPCAGLTGFARIICLNRRVP